jgi:hypothetical protein
MASHPVNLTIRFLLELAALAALGYWGWHQSDGPFRYVLALGIPLIAAAAWGSFNVANDPSRSGQAPIPVSGLVRLGLELALFGFATWGLFDLGMTYWGWMTGIAVIVHYGVSYDRVQWLIKQ